MPHGMQVINITYCWHVYHPCSISPKSSNRAYNRHVHMYISSFHNWERLRHQACVCICCRVLHLLLWTESDSRSCVSNAQCCWNKLHLSSTSARATWRSFFGNFDYKHTHAFSCCPLSPNSQSHYQISVDCRATGTIGKTASHFIWAPQTAEEMACVFVGFFRLGSAGCCQSPLHSACYTLSRRDS